MIVYYRLRAWWHAQWYKPTDVTPFDDNSCLVNCSCGGYAQLERQADGLVKVTYTTCPVWRWARRARPLRLPVARALP